MATNTQPKPFDYSNVGKVDGKSLSRQAIEQGLPDLPMIPKPFRELNIGGKKIQMDGKLPSYIDPAAPGPDVPHDQLPNYDKLSGTERFVMNILPGFAESGIGKALANFGESWMGKALSHLNVGAEAITRAGGVVAQFQDAVNSGTVDQFNQQLGAAWYSGALLMDVAQVPMIKDGRLAVDMDLPGAGILTKFRHEIYDRTLKGEDPGAVLTDIRARFYQDEGALALRSQLHSALFQAVVDPLNWLLPMVKPVERLQLARSAIVTSKFAYPEEVTAQITRLGNELAQARKIDDVGKMAEITAAIKNYQRLDELTPWENIVLKLTGGLPGSEVGSRLNPFALTREAKAMEMVDNFVNNFETRIVAASPDPGEWVRILKKVRDGLAVPELGAMTAVPEGRVLSANIEILIGRLESLDNSYKASAYQRELLNMVANAIDSDPMTVYGKLQEGGEHAIIQAFNNAVNSQPDLGDRMGKLLGSFGRSADNLATDISAIPRLVKSDIYTPELFRLSAIRLAGDTFGQVAAARYGLAARGFVSKLSHMVKSAETLAFLKANPSYPIKNFLNNELTMIARGIYGGFSVKEAEALWLKLGFEPSRLGIGLGPAEINTIRQVGRVGEEGAAAVDAASSAIGEMTHGAQGWTDRVVKAINGVNLGKFDMGRWASEIERSASIRATTYGYLEGWKHFWKPQVMSEFDPLYAQVLPEDVRRAIESAARSATTPQDLEQAIYEAKNIASNGANVVELASKRMGADLGALLDPAFQQQHMPEILAAAEQGPSAVADVISRLKVEAEQHISDLVTESLNNIRDEAHARIATQGPSAYLTVWGDMMDDMYAGMSAHARNLGTLTAEARSADPEHAAVMWASIADQESNHFRRMFDTMDSRMQGFARGAEEAGLTEHAQAIPSEFREWRGSWENFHSWKNDQLERFFTAKRAGEMPHRQWDDLMAEIDMRYDKVTMQEAKYMKRIDRMMGSMMPKEQLPAFKSWRDAVAKWRGLDRDLVKTFRTEVRDLAPDKIGEAWNKHWHARQQLWKQQVLEERMGMAAMMGDPQSMARYRAASAKWSDVSDLIHRSVIGEGLPPEIAADPEQAMAARARLLEIAKDEMTANGNLPDYEDLQKQLDTFENLRAPVQRELTAVDEILSRGRTISGEPHNTIALEAKNFKPLSAEELRAAGKPNNGAVLWEQLTKDQQAALVEVQGGQRQAVLFLDKLVGEASPEVQARIMSKMSLMRKTALARVEADLRGAEFTFSYEEGGLVTMHGPNLKEASFYLPTDKRPAVLNLRQVEKKGLGTGEKSFLEQLRFLKDRGETLVRRTGVTEDGKAFWDRMVEKGYVTLKREVEDDPLDPLAQRMSKITGGGKQTYWEYEIGNIPPVGANTKDLKTIPDFGSVVGNQMYVGTGLNELWLNRTGPAMDAIGEAALDTRRTGRQIKFADMNPEQQQAIRTYVEGMKGQMADARYASTRYALFKRDSSLLNYNRRMNYNTWLGTVMPYEFWMTNTMFRWALHSIDRPAMLSSYLRMQKFLRTAMRPEGGLPARLQGSVRIPFPFLPKWMGQDIFVDPFRSALPFENIAYPFEQAANNDKQLAGTVNYNLKKMLDAGQITQSQYDVAVETKKGEAYNLAVAQAQMDNKEQAANPLDTISMLSAPHAPLLWAYNVAKGTPEDIQPFLPLTRTVKGLTALLGLGGPGGFNPEASLRTALGLPAFDKWDDYRVDRMLSNMAGAGEISADVARQAMIERGKSGDSAINAAFRTASERAGKEFGVGAMGSLIGIPARPYPPGEEAQRHLADDYQYAWKQYEKGDRQALDTFFKEHPDYEARLALYKKPEERLHTFLVEHMWDRWNEMPSLTRSAVTDQLGPEFVNSFLDKQTRNTDAISNDQLSVWLSQIGNNPFIDQPHGAPLSLPPQDVAYRADAFYATRKALFPNYYELQNDYYKLAEGAARRSFLASHPDLKQYWTWKNDFLKRNPTVAPYINENWEPAYKSEAQLRQAEQAQPAFSILEWRMILPPELFRLLSDVAGGGRIPNEMQDAVDRESAKLGITPAELINKFSDAFAAQQ